MPVRRIVAFFFMVVGMFMAILDIQVVSASLAEIQAGLSAGSDEIGWASSSIPCCFATRVASCSSRAVLLGSYSTPTRFSFGRIAFIVVNCWAGGTSSEMPETFGAERSYLSGSSTRQ